jgi:D-alanine-D-alanine ligase-like ATP-grasp enzyme
MQTLILCEQFDSVIQDYSLEYFFKITTSTFIIDSYKNLYAKGGRINSTGLLVKERLTTFKNKVDLYPSFLLFADSDDKLREKKHYQKINKILLIGHPYCQQILFNTKELDNFFKLTFSRSVVIERHCSAQAFIHIASLKQRIIKIHGLKVCDESLQVVQKQIELQLEYEFSQVYDAMLSEIKFDETQEIDKSITLFVNFSVDSRVDLHINIDSVSVIGIDNHHNYHNFNLILSSILDDLVLVKQQKNSELGSNNKHYIRACNELNVSCEPITRNKYLMKKNNQKAIYIPYHRTLQKKEAIDQASSKAVTNQKLKAQGFKVNKNITLDVKLIDAQQIDNIFLELTPPFVLKPTDQSAGYGVYLNIQTKDLFERVVDELKNLDKVSDIIIEEQFKGSMYRFLVIGDKVKAVLRSDYPLIYGNGSDSFKKLIAAYNQLNRRKIRINNTMKLYFDSLNLSMTDIPHKGQKIVASLKKIGDITFNVTDSVQDRFKQIAIDVNKASGLVVNGVDMMISEQGDYRIIELNPVPALYQHLAPDYGESLDIFKDIVDYLLQNASHDIFDCSAMCDYHN